MPGSVRGPDWSVVGDQMLSCVELTLPTWFVCACVWGWGWAEGGQGWGVAAWGCAVVVGPMGVLLCVWVLKCRPCGASHVREHFS
jgi:hypothetical protein